MHQCAYGPLLLLITSTSALESKMAARSKVAAVIGYGDFRRRITLPMDDHSPTHSNVANG